MHCHVVVRVVVTQRATNARSQRRHRKIEGGRPGKVCVNEVQGTKTLGSTCSHAVPIAAAAAAVPTGRPDIPHPRERQLLGEEQLPGPAEKPKRQQGVRLRSDNAVTAVVAAGAAAAATAAAVRLSAVQARGSGGGGRSREGNWTVDYHLPLRCPTLVLLRVVLFSSADV